MTKEKIVLITGASSGIGEAIAKKLASEGYQVLLHGRNEDKLINLAAFICQQNGTAEIFLADLTDANERKRFIEEIDSKCTCPSLIINNAGFGYYGYFHQMSKTLAHDMSDLMIDAIIDIDHHFIPLMLEKGEGHILHISSIIGAMPNQGVAMYCAVKSFIDVFCTSLYRELRGSGVMISMVRPGPVKTAFFDRAKKQENGGAIPGEAFSISAEQVAKTVWKNIKTPKRVRYVPGWMVFTKFWEPFFGWFVDLLGPLLLKQKY